MPIGMRRSKCRSRCRRLEGAPAAPACSKGASREGTATAEGHRAGTPLTARDLAGLVLCGPSVMLASFPCWRSSAFWSPRVARRRASRDRPSGDMRSSKSVYRRG
jgi:hypothetical protein